MNAVNGLHVLEFSSRPRLDTFAIGSYPAPRMLPVPRRASSALTLKQNVFTLIDQGIAKGGLKAPEEAKLHLGMAYLQSGNKAKAAEIFKTIQGSDGTADLGRYWLLVK